MRVNDINPYSAEPSKSQPENALKVTVKGEPRSVDENEVIKMLNDFNVFFTTELKYEKNSAFNYQKNDRYSKR